MISHETIRVAVIGKLKTNSCDARNIPQVLKVQMVQYFKINFESYKDIVESKVDLSGKPMNDPHKWSYNRKFQYKSIFTNLQTLRSSLENN
jgi:hypothetical protein